MTKRAKVPAAIPGLARNVSAPMRLLLICTALLVPTKAPATPSPADALRAAADQILMLDPLRSGGGVSEAEIFNAGRVQLWSSTIGGLHFAPEQIFTRLFGPGRASTEFSARGRDVIWRTAHLKLRVGTVTEGGDHLRFEPSRRALHWRNAKAGDAILRLLQSAVKKGALVEASRWQPVDGRGPFQVAYALQAKHPNLLAQLARSNPMDPLLASLAPMPSVRFVNPDAVTRSGMDKVGQDIALWRQAHHHPTNPSPSDTRECAIAIANAQAYGHLAPLELTWLDGEGRHRLGIRTETRGGGLKRMAWYQGPRPAHRQAKRIP